MAVGRCVSENAQGTLFFNKPGKTVLTEKSLVASKAVRRISSSLGIQAEITKRYDQYMVIIPGFFSREQTWKYFPELAGVGFPGVKIIEKKQNGL